MKKGFTIIELIITIVIIAIIGGIGILAYNTIFASASTSYYKTVENSILLSGTEYFEKNREELPIKGYSIVSLDNLEEGNYISPVKDKNGNQCEKGDVYVIRDSKTNQYEYEVCLKCSEYESDGKFCRGYIPGEINVDAYLEKNNNQKYNPLLSYKNVSAINDNLIVNLVLEDETLSYFKIDKINNQCTVSDYSCTVKIEKSGSYLVSAYDKEGNKIANDRVLNVKIDKENPTFELKNDKRYTIEDEKDNRNVNIKLENVQDDIGIQEIKYCIKEIGVACDNEDYQELGENVYTINETIKSGSYHIEVIVKDLVGNETNESSEFDVSYYAILEYEDGTREQFEVVTGKSYGYLNTLPNIYNEKLIKWLYNENNITNETKVTETKRHTLKTEETDKIDIVTNAYCADITYNGKNQKITKDAPSGVTFTNNTGTNAGSYTVKAKILYGLSWSDGTTSDKEFTCTIKKKTPDLNLDKTSGTLTYGTNQTVTITTDGDGALSCSSSDTTVATCSISGKTLTITPQANTIDNKTATITVSQVATSNYLSISKTYSATVNRKTLTCPSSPSDKTYNGSEQNSGVTCPSGSTAGGTQKATNANTYSQTCTASKGYKFSSTCSVSWKINKAQCDLAIEAAYSDGTTSATNATSGSVNNGDSFNLWFSSNVCSNFSVKSSNTSVLTAGSINKSTTYSGYSKMSSVGGGTSTITVTVSGGDNYDSYSRTFATTVRILSTAPTLTATTVTYDGKSHCVGVTAGTSGLNIQYAWRTVGGTWSAWSTDKEATACGTNVGEWEIVARTAGNANYITSANSNIVKLTINSNSCKYEYVQQCGESDSYDGASCYKGGCTGGSYCANCLWTCRKCDCDSCT